MIIFGWLRRFTLLGVKFEECASCGAICEHPVGRKTMWGHIFWMPLLLLGFSHGMICSSCGVWTGIGWREVRAGMKSGSLHLQRARPNAMASIADGIGPGDPELVPAIASGAAFDGLLINPKRGFWDAYLKAWPVLLVVVLVLGGVNAALKGQVRSVADDSAPAYPTSLSAYGPAHACWEDLAETIVGCRLADGSILGTTSGYATTCYFYGPLSATATSVRCD